MKNLKILAVFALSLTFLFTACTNTKQLLETGNYTRIIDMTVKKLAGKKKKNPELVAALEEAFLKATSADMRRIDQMKKSGKGNIWAKIYDIQTQIAHRQAKVSPLLPLIDKNGYQAEFSFVKIDKLLNESRANAAEYQYLQGKSALALARKGDKNAARAAYEILADTRIYLDNYKDTNGLMHEAHELGIVHIIYENKNRANASLSYEMRRELESVSLRDFNTFWKRYYAKPVKGIDYDYRIVMNIENMQAGREIVREREYVDYKEIRDGWDYVLDQNGNVLKDTLGNDVKTPRMVITEAFVLENYQFKNASVKGRLEYFDVHTGELAFSDVIRAESIFENYASTFRGDRRALSDDSRSRIGNSPRPFPSNNYLLTTAIKKMLPVIRDKMSRRDLVPRNQGIVGI